MGLFDKKKKAELPLPPPPPRQSPAEMPLPELPQFPPPSDFEPIRVRDDIEIPEPPELPPRPMPIPEPIHADFAMEEEVNVAPPRTVPAKSFIAVEDFKSIVNNSNVVRAKVMEAEELIKHLGAIKSEEEQLFEKWRTNLEQIEKKLNFVDKVIEKAGGNYGY